MANISSFTNALQGGGARANQFEVAINGGGGTGLSQRNFTFLCRSAQIPALTIGEISIPYRGRQIFVAGDRTYDAWTVTIMNDRKYDIRSHLESWMNNMGDVGAVTTARTLNASEYYATATVQQKDRNDATIRTYTLAGVWPTTLDAIDLAYDTNDAIEEFGATFRFNWLTATASDVTAGGGQLNINVSYSGSFGSGAGDIGP